MNSTFYEFIIMRRSTKNPRSDITSTRGCPFFTLKITWLTSLLADKALKPLNNVPFLSNAAILRNCPWISIPLKGGKIFQRSLIHSGRSSDFRIILLAAPSHSTEDEQWLIAAFVPDYSGGPVPESHGVPFNLSWALNEHLNRPIK